MAKNFYPKVSVIIPTFNRAGTLERALKSILRQTFQDFEIIVVDDHSRDNTGDLVREINDPRIFYICHDVNKGGAVARNTGIKQARGEYIAFLDSDDEWLPGKLELQLDLFERSSEDIGVIYTGFFNVDLGGHPLSVFSPHLKGDLSLELLKGNGIMTLSTVMVRRRLISEVEGFDATLPSCQDWDFYLQLSKICKFDFVGTPLANYFYEKTGEQITNNVGSVLKGHRIIFEKYGISLCPRKIRSDHYFYLGNVYRHCLKDLSAVTMFIKAFFLSPSLRSLKWIVLTILRRPYHKLSK